MRHFRAKSQHLDTLVSSQRRHLRERGLRGLKQSLLLIISERDKTRRSRDRTNKGRCLDLRCMQDCLSDSHSNDDYFCRFRLCAIEISIYQKIEVAFRCLKIYPSKIICAKNMLEHSPDVSSSKTVLPQQRISK